MRPLTSSLLRAGLAAVALAAGAQSAPLAAEKTQNASPAVAAPAAPAIPPAWDRPVIDFLRTPAILLMTPDEALEYDRLADNVQRRRFIDRFWTRVGTNCTAAKNPFRDAVWQRSLEAMKLFGDEGVPGWLTDRGRFYVLLGPPATTATEESGGVRRLVWTWSSVKEGQPKTVVFVQERLRWAFAGADGDAGTALRPVKPIVATLAAAYRRQACELTAEERAAASTLAWRKSLYETAGQVLAGQRVEVASPLEPAWYFFPAEGDATLVLLTVPLPAALPDGQRLVAVLRRDGDDEGAYGFGTEDVPFELRPSATGPVAQALRTLPAGRYAVALGVADAAGEAVPRFAAEQLVVRFARDAFRLTSVIMAEQIKPVEGAPADEVKPFRIGGYEIVPRPSRVAHHGETVTFFGVVNGLGQGPVDLKVRYAVQFQQPGKGWISVGQFEKPLNQAVLAQDLQIVPKLPQGDYKLSISITDPKGSAAPLTQEVPFRIRPKA